MKHLICVIALLGLVFCAAPRPATAQASQPYVGEIEIFAIKFCPSGWVPLNGALLLISGNETLYALLGTTYGGDGLTTFAVPKWAPINTANGGTLLACISLYGVFPSAN